MQDMIAIHFQKPSTGGGEVENVCYVSKGIKFAYFERDRECSISAQGHNEESNYSDSNGVLFFFLLCKQYLKLFFIALFFLKKL